jgi:hypothetical protein
MQNAYHMHLLYRTREGGMREPYGVLNAGEWSLWCRACLWRSVPRQADPQVFKAARDEADTEWRVHQCVQAPGAPAHRLQAVGPVPLSTLEVA